MYWFGAFPTAGTVKSYNDNLYATGFDSALFIQSNPKGAETLSTPDQNHEYDIYQTPEPGTMALPGSSLALLIGLVHFLASDAHDGTHRPPLLDEARRYTARHYGEEMARLPLEDNPRAALTGADLPCAEMQVKKRSWFSRFYSNT